MCPLWFIGYWQSYSQRRKMSNNQKKKWLVKKMTEYGKMTEEQHAIWEISYRYRYSMPLPSKNHFGLIFWKRFEERNIYCDDIDGSELLHLAYHQVGKDNRPLRFFETHLIELHEFSEKSE